MTRAYASSGSGGYAAGAVLERNFKFGMTVSSTNFAFIILFYYFIVF